MGCVGDLISTEFCNSGFQCVFNRAHPIGLDLGNRDIPDLMGKGEEFQQEKTIKSSNLPIFFFPIGSLTNADWKKWDFFFFLGFIGRKFLFQC